MKQTINNYFNTNLKYPISAKIYGKCVKQDDETISCLEKVKLNSQELSLPLYGIPDESSKVIFNQLVNYNNVVTFNNYGYKIEKIGNGKIKFSGNATAQLGWFRFVPNINLIVGHKMLYIDNATNSINRQIYLNNTKKLLSITFFEVPNEVSFELSVIINRGVDVNYEIQPQLIDLTLMYGEGNEPTSIDQIPSWIKDKYHPYNTGSIEYLNWKVRDTWENCKQTKRVRVVDLGSLQFGNVSSSGTFYIRRAPGGKVGALGVKPNILLNKNLTIIESAYSLSSAPDKSITFTTGTSEILIKDITLANKTSDELKILFDGVLLFYEVNEPIETITSTLLVADEGDNKISFEDNNENIIDTDFELGYNELKNYKVGGKLVKYVNDRKVDAIYEGKPTIESLLGKQNISTTNTNKWLTFNNNNTFSLENSLGPQNRKRLNNVGGHKIFVYYEIDNIPQTNIRVILYSLSAINTINYNKQNEVSLTFLKNGCFGLKECSLYDDYNSIFPAFYNINSVILEKINSAIVIDLTELGLDNLTAQQFYDKYHNDFDRLANGQFISDNLIYEKPQLPNGFHELESIESTGAQYIDTGLAPDNPKVKCKIQITNRTGSANMTVFGRETFNAQRFLLTTNSNKFIFFSGGGNSYPNDYLVDEIFEIEATKQYQIINDYRTTNRDFSTSENGNIWISKCGNYNGKYKYYYFKMLGDANDNLVYLLPCKRTLDNEIGMIDLVSGKFFTNQGTGNFIAHEFGENNI